MKEQYEFPPEFIWGASTAAHQIEGNNVASDWWAREHAERTDLSEPSGDAADSYHRYGEDIRMLADAGLGMYRFSIEWARIEPAEGCFSKAQLLHYRQMIDACHENGVEPMVTLNHMTLPLWLATKGGWLNADAVDYFARYVRYVMPILHDVTWVCTINEPNMVALTRGGTEGSDFVAAYCEIPYTEVALSEDGMTLTVTMHDTFLSSGTLSKDVDPDFLKEYGSLYPESFPAGELAGSCTLIENADLRQDGNNAVLTVTLADGPIHGRNFGDGYYRFTAETGYTGIADIGPYLRVTLNATNELFAGN